MKKRVVCIGVVTLFLPLMSGHSAVHYVHPDSALNNLQAGLDLCSPHDTVLITAEYNWWGNASGPYYPTLNPAGTGDSISDYIDFLPWSQNPVGIDDGPTEKPLEEGNNLRATIISGKLGLPHDKKYRIIDITGREIDAGRLSPGIYFVEIDGRVVKKVIKIR